MTSRALAWSASWPDEDRPTVAPSNLTLGFSAPLPSEVTHRAALTVCDRVPRAGADLMSAALSLLPLLTTLSGAAAFHLAAWPGVAVLTVSAAAVAVVVCRREARR